MSTNGFLLLLAGVAAAWFFSLYSMRRQVRSYQREVRRLRDLCGSAGEISEQHLNSLLAAVDQVMLRMNSRGMVVAANASALSLFSIKAEDLPQSILSFYRDSDWHDAFKQVFNRLPQEGKLPDILLPDITMAGRVLMPRVARLGDNEVLMLCLDITDKHRLEIQRRSFMANLMHDLKTPLTSLLGYARSLQRFGDDPGFRQEAIQVIADEAKHVNHLLDAMLTLDQIEFAGSDPDASCDAEDVIRQVCDMLKEPVSNKKISLICDIPDDLPDMRMDVDSFERVVRNLLENATQYAPKGGRVTLSLQQEGEMGRLVVRDDGPGIPDKHLKRVTERFYRVDKARSREYGGHGLGLAIVKELCEAHGGSVQLANVDPHGLEATLAIPFA
ncbi:sensor histidine kinase [Mariprofundus ferrooxydans]|uniref:sensor histidine kinase n=1 Tax=Mariprofundus ferrooxydans TaxID=314344 RepID=UPI00036FE4B0|nr:ATP-binding protein [Mariprofundus ferrooxydans]